VFPVRYELYVYILLRRNSVFKRLIILEMLGKAAMNKFSGSREEVMKKICSCEFD
jgi:hypothetical protein